LAWGSIPAEERQTYARGFLTKLLTAKTTRDFAKAAKKRSIERQRVVNMVTLESGHSCSVQLRVSNNSANFAVVENIPHLARQLLQRKWFLQEVAFDVDHFMIEHSLPGVT
jgi:hypothetical protein